MTRRLVLVTCLVLTLACSSSPDAGHDTDDQGADDPGGSLFDAPLFDQSLFDATGTDAPDGSADDPGPLPDGVDVDGPPCETPLVWQCQGKDKLVRCVNGRLFSMACGDENACVDGACQPEVCEAAATECTGFDTQRRCNDTGTAWEVDQTCPGVGEIVGICDAGTGKCGCRVPVNVLFVLDASGSMQLEEVSAGVTQWDVARDAMAQIMAEYPFLKFGLATFPQKTVDCSADACEGTGGCAYADDLNLDVAPGQVDAIQGYLATRKLSADPANLKYVLTPLLGIFDYLANGYPADGLLKAHQYPSYVVLLSDGQDSCYNPLNPAAATAPLAARVQQLADQWSIRTFAIGFNLANGFEELDAIAMHGGTGFAEHVPASDLASLLSAFEGIFENMGILKCGSWDNTPAAPDCTDADADGWCASLDCDDGAATVSPGADELGANGADDDCDSVIDEPPDAQQDQDGDGVTPEHGDCNDFRPAVNPAALEEPENGIDDDCDGQTDEGGCACTPTTGASLAAMACAAEISCNADAFQGQGLDSPTGDDLAGAWEAVAHFGAASNDLTPKAGTSYALLATGPATGTSHTTDLSGWDSWSDPYSSSDACYDVAEWTVTLKAPANAKGFSIDYVFFSEEYDDFVGTEYNDKFYILMQAPQTTGNQKRVINFTDCRDPASYHDLTGAQCPLASGYCCYIAINTALSECCWYDGCPDGTWTTDIAGTGYSCAGSQFADSASAGSSTGWLTTSWPIQAGETFTLTFHVHDTSDGIYDSEVLLDNFRWRSTATAPGTEPSH